MLLHRDSDGQQITLDPAQILGAGGEAIVYRVAEDPSLAAKIYRKPTDTRAHKLLAMSTHPPVDPMAASGHCSIAWPMELLRTPGRRPKVAGFLMPRVDRMSPIIDLYSPHARLLQRPWFNYQRLLRTGYNLAATVSAVHAGGYVVGDLNYTNVLVSGDALVTLIDTDSFQVPDPDQKMVYRCTVYTPEFTPPELQNNTGREKNRGPEHDLFGLAVLIYLLLMGGNHPFSGTYIGNGQPELLAARIEKGQFPYSTKKIVDYNPAPVAPPLDILTPTLRQLVITCFEDGDAAPQMRPSPEAWQAALLEAEETLVSCSANSQHGYSGHLEACPWCERTEQLGGRDPFPSRYAVNHAEHLKPIPVPQTLPAEWSPRWHYRRERSFPRPLPLTPSFNTRAWVVLVLTLWVFLPVFWGLVAWQFPVALPAYAGAAMTIYGLTGAMVPIGLGMMSWRRAQAYGGGGILMVVAGLGSVGGLGLIGAYYWLRTFG